MDFTDKRVLVTGASRGIGKATAQAFLGHGAKVAVNGSSAETTARAIEELGGGALVAAPGDVATKAGCDAVVDAALDGLGGLDILVNNAGVYETGAVEDFDEAAWDRIIDINVKGVFFCTRAAIEALRSAGGNIVNTASVSGLIGHPDSAVYCASKGAVVNMTRAMALEFAPTVRVNCVCPGAVDTDMMRQGLTPGPEVEASLAASAAAHPLERIATAEEIAAAMLYLASDDARFVTGAALAIDGGFGAGQ